MRVVIVEDASRFARHLLTQEAGISLLVGLGVRVLTAAGDDLTDSDDEFRVAMRQIMGVFSQLEKTRLVKKLKAARDRKRTNGKVEGRKSHLEARPEVVAEAKRLHRASPKTGERRNLPNIDVTVVTFSSVTAPAPGTSEASSNDCVAFRCLPEPLSAQLGRALLRLEIHVHEPEAGTEAVSPFEVPFTGPPSAGAGDVEVCGGSSRLRT